LCLVWVFRLSAFCNPPPEVGPLRAPTASFSHRHLPHRCSGRIAPEPSPVECSAFSFMFYLVSLYLVSFVLFCFDFPLYFVLLDFPVFALVFPYIAYLCLFRVFFSFYSSADLLRACFVTLCPLLGLFPRPHRVELPTRPSVYEICLHAIGVKE
jgi:hypothetical protein